MIKVMLVEDEVGTRNLLQIMINWADFNMVITSEAKNGQDALIQIKKDMPNLIITDIRMPIMDGLELVKSLKSSNYPVKVIIMTAYDEFEYARQAVKLGVVDFIMKPLKRDELKEALSKAGKFFEEENTDHDKIFEKVKLYMIKHLSESKLSLSGISEAFYLNPSYLSRVFKKSTGMTITDYLLNLRIEQACRYFKTTDLKAYEVGEKVGIPNSDYFGRCFKRITGKTISEFCKGQNSTE